jgi:hypothetical protein
MNRTQLTLAVVLILQIALILLIRSPFSTASARTEARLLLPELEAITPTRVEIDGKEDAHITLVRQGETWAIEEIGAFPADNEKVERLLGDLGRIEVRRPVVTSSRYHEAFKVTDDENEARVRLWDSSDDDARVDLIVGSSPNYRTTHVRLGDENEIFEIQGIAPYDVRPDQGAWIRKELLEPSEKLFERLSLANEAGRFELEKRDGAWAVASPPESRDDALDQDKVEALLRAATSLRLADAAGPSDDDAHGFASPAATLVLGRGPGEPTDDDVTLAVGSKVVGEETQRYVTRAGYGFTGTIWESSVKSLLEDSLDSLRPASDEG